MTKKVTLNDHPAFAHNSVTRTKPNADAAQSRSLLELSDGIRLRSVHFRHANDGSPAKGYMWVLRTVNGATRPLKVPVEGDSDDIWLLNAHAAFLALVGG